MIYGYVRISTRKQSLERQIRNILAEYPKAQIIEEVFTGTSMNREKWNKLVKKVQPGDIIVFDSVSRMSRTAAEGFDTYQELFSKGIDLVFLKERHIDTKTYKDSIEKNLDLTGNELQDILIEAINKTLLLLAKQQILLAFEQAEKEVEDLRQRTKEGLRGKDVGRKPGQTFETKKAKECKEQIKKHSRDFGGTLNNIELQNMLKISRNSLYKYKRELLENI